DFSTKLRDIATSLRIESGKDWDRPELAAELLRHMDADYKRLSSGAFDSIASEWESLCGTLGRNVRVQMGDRMLQGTAEALDSEGALLLRTSHGSLERILGGDVTVMKS
ncbi:MAG: biotin--[acetyl-CoA-carboxylase] ligase, partial [Verrucomicrobia bacterium]|nr:biotin--[acetyl-CoA-carboxylase] ligase [Verrucomicrobiota bacterium]